MSGIRRVGSVGSDQAGGLRLRSVGAEVDGMGAGAGAEVEGPASSPSSSESEASEAGGS